MSNTEDSLVGSKIKPINYTNIIGNWLVIVGEKSQVYYLDGLESYLEKKQNPRFEYDLKNGLCIEIDFPRELFIIEKA